MKPDFSHLAETWQSPIVARSSVDKLTGDAMLPRHLANLDSKGKGPPDRFRVGRKICYDVFKLLKWLEDRSEIV